MIENVREYTEDAGARQMREILERDARRGYIPNQEIASVIRELKGPKGDFGLLQRIVDKHLEKAHASEKVLFKDLKIYQVSPRTWATARFSPVAFTVMNTDAGVMAINDAASTKLNSMCGNVRLATLHTFVHELGHVSAGRQYVEMRGPNDEHLIKKIDGVQQEVIEIIKNEDGEYEEKADSELKTRLLAFFDDGLNDEFAEEVARDFAQATGFASKKELDAFYKAYQRGGRIYDDTRRAIRAIVREIATYVGVPEDVVRQGLRQSLLASFDFVSTGQDEDTGSVLNDVLGDGFTQDLAHIHGKQSLVSFLKKYKLESFFERLKNEIAQIVA